MLRDDVNILLSTYNGEKYLPELLESLTNQTYSPVKITIRDDGSRDNTIKTIETFAAGRKNISFYKGENLGVVNSFFWLLREAETSGYYALCDQDDVWLPDKLERAVDAINEHSKGKPMMYCSAYNLVDKKLNFIGKRSTKIKKPSYGNALVENIATGCTVVINNSARDILINKLPENALMHDWWIYLVVSAFGQVIYDPNPSILYRQHASNVVGAQANMMTKWMNRVKQYKKRNGERLIFQQVFEFYNLYKNQMDKKTLDITEKFLNDTLINRIKNCFFSPFYRQSAIDNMIYKILYLQKKI